MIDETNPNGDHYLFYETSKTVNGKEEKKKKQDVFSENQRLVIFIKELMIEDKNKQMRKIQVVYKDPIVFTNSSKQEKIIYMYSMYLMKATDKYLRFAGSSVAYGLMEEAYQTTLGYLFGNTSWKENFYAILAGGYLCKYLTSNLDQIINEHQLSNYKHEIVKQSPKYPQRKYIIILKNVKNNKTLMFSVKDEQELTKWDTELAKYCYGGALQK